MKSNRTWLYIISPFHPVPTSSQVIIGESCYESLNHGKATLTKDCSAQTPVFEPLD